MAHFLWVSIDLIFIITLKNLLIIVDIPRFCKASADHLIWIMFWDCFEYQLNLRRMVSQIRKFQIYIGKMNVSSGAVAVIHYPRHSLPIRWFFCVLHSPLG